MKRKINIDRPNLSSQEIASRQDFSSLMKQLPKVTKPPFYKTGWFITTVASVAGIAVITTNFVLNDKNSTPNQELAYTASTETPPSAPHQEVIETIATQNPAENLTVSFVNETVPKESPEKVMTNSDSDISSEQLDQQIAQYNQEAISAKTAYDIAVQSRLSFEKKAPVKPTSQGNPDRQFVLDVNPQDFPELSLYKDLLFEVEADDPNFTPSVYQEEWEDIKLKTKEPGKTYFLSLFRGQTSKTFSVFPVFKGSNYDIALQNYEKELMIYQAELEKLKTTEHALKVEYDQITAKLNSLENEENNLSETN